MKDNAWFCWALRMRISVRADSIGPFVAAFQAAGRFTRDSQPGGLG